jgi:rRNA maturation endonuclease Nob1
MDKGFLHVYPNENNPARQPTTKAQKLLQLTCTACGKGFEVDVYQELCPECTGKKNKALSKLHGMVFK